MRQGNRHLDEHYFMRSFYSGLKEEVRHMVELLCPHTLEQAYMMARKQEVMLESMNKGSRTVTKPPISWQKNEDSGSVSKYVPVKRLSKEQLEERKKKGLCFNCDEPYTYGHQCKKLFVILLEEGADTTERMEFNDDIDADCVVSLHALKGQPPAETIKLVGKVKNNDVVILVDSGSTHSFLDPNAVKRVNCEVEVTNPLQVTVAGGGRIQCSARCPNFEWEMAGQLFSTNMRVLPLGGYDMVLGVDIMRRLGPVLLDYVLPSITFQVKGKPVMVPGMQSGVSVKLMTGNKLHNLFNKKNKLVFSCFCMVNAVED